MGETVFPDKRWTTVAITDSEDAMGPGSVDVGLLPKTPEMGIQDSSIPPQGDGVTGKAISLDQPSPELSIVPASRQPARITNMAVPKFDGTVCWQQHQQVFSAIAKSNDWDDKTAALQLFAHLEGEALNVALLMPEDKRATRDGPSEVLSEYYNSPGRPAIFKRKFDSVAREEDPAAFATQLAVRGFGDVGPRARTRMVCDRFKSGQRDCGLRCHLDSVPPDTPIRDIVDPCRMWESHSDKNRKSPPITDVGRKYGYSRESSFYTDGSPGMYPRRLNRVSRWHWSRMFLVKDHPCWRSGTESCWIRP